MHVRGFFCFCFQALSSLKGNISLLQMFTYQIKENFIYTYLVLVTRKPIHRTSSPGSALSVFFFIQKVTIY